MYCKSPVVWRQTDFPPALGPEITSIRLSVVRPILSGTTFFPAFLNKRYSRGWTAFCQLIPGLSDNEGLIPLMLFANNALALIKSINPRKLNESLRSSI